jgi:hypothetical protein
MIVFLMYISLKNFIKIRANKIRRKFKIEGHPSGYNVLRTVGGW